MIVLNEIVLKDSFDYIIIQYYAKVQYLFN